MNDAEHFKDGGCRDALYAADLPCGQAPIAYLVDLTFGFCSPKFSHLYVAVPYTGPVYTIQSGHCQAYVATNGLSFFSPGQNMEPKVFPALTETTDP
jgi:hypothetical protein